MINSFPKLIRKIIIGIVIPLYFCVAIVQPAYAERVHGHFIPNRLDDQRIIGGIEASLGEYPWATALIFADSNPPVQFCGGSLVTPNWVLTAAHCTFDFFRNPIFPDDVDTFLGDTDLNASTNSFERISVDQIVRHPDYNRFIGVVGGADVALLHLSSPSQQETINLIDSDSIFDDPGVLSTVIGWGVDDTGTLSSVLREVDVPIISNTTCNAPVSYDGRILDDMLCAGFIAGGQDACQGDSGGPIVTTLSSGEDIQVGIVSWGDGCALPQKYGVYARVGVYENWINNIIGQRNTVSNELIDLVNQVSDLERRVTLLEDS